MSCNDKITLTHERIGNKVRYKQSTINSALNNFINNN